MLVERESSLLSVVAKVFCWVLLSMVEKFILLKILVDKDSVS